MSLCLRMSLIPSRIRFFVGLIICLISVPGLAQAERTSQSIEVTCRIEPQLALTISPATGERIDFGVLPSFPTEAALSDIVPVQLHIFSNLGKPYQVTQEFRAPLTNETGDVLPVDSFQRVGAGTESSTVFQSDSKGLSADPTVSYRLRIPPGQAGGTYRGTLVMTVIAQ